MPPPAPEAPRPDLCANSLTVLTVLTVLIDFVGRAATRNCLQATQSWPGRALPLTVRKVRPMWSTRKQSLSQL